MSNRSVIAVGVDAAWARTGVVDWALQESRFSSSPLRAVHVVDERVPAGAGPVGAEVGDARRLVVEVSEYLRGHGGGLAHTADVRAGRPGRALVEAADDCRMLVVGRHGRGMLGRLLIGSTAESAAYQARIPVVVVPEKWVPPVDTAAPILVGVDEDEQSEAAIGFAVELAAERRVPLRLVHVWDVASIYTWDATPAATTVAEWRDHNEARLEAIVQRWRDKYPDVTFQTKLTRGHAVYGLLDAARDAEAQLLVLGGRRHGRVASMLLGSTARAVLQHAPCPIAIVHDDQA